MNYRGLIVCALALLFASTGHAYYGEPEPPTDWTPWLAGWAWLSTCALIAWGGSKKGYHPAAVFFACFVATPVAVWMGLLLAPPGTWAPRGKVPAYMMNTYADVKGDGYVHN